MRNIEWSKKVLPHMFVSLILLKTNVINLLGTGYILMLV